MFAFARVAQLFLLFVAVIACPGASTDAHSSGSGAAIETQTEETAVVESTPAYGSEKIPDQGSLPRFAMLAPEQSDRHDEQTPAYAEPFGQPTLTALPGDVSSKWAGLQSRLVSETATLAACRNDEATCSPAARRLLSIVELGRQHQGRALLGRINRAANLSIRPISDWAQYGVSDYWATPLETLNTGAGDCEDYAIVKYVALREAGIDPGDLRLVIVRNIKEQTNHAVLAVRFEGDWQILDNRTLVMVNADMAQYYYPLFVLDQRGARAFVTAVARR